VGSTIHIVNEIHRTRSPLVKAFLESARRSGRTEANLIAGETHTQVSPTPADTDLIFVDCAATRVK